MKEIKAGDRFKLNPKYLDEGRFKQSFYGFFNDTKENMLKYEFVFKGKNEMGNYGFDVKGCSEVNSAKFKKVGDGFVYTPEVIIFDGDGPFLRFDDVKKSIFCSCDNRKSKHVILSKTLQYDFCSNCKKEINDAQ